jgi:phosphoglycolate phosphatase-like HAD superfamily hydrolase
MFTCKAFAFDRDGTVTWGSPPGPIKKEYLLELRKLGYDIGGSGGQLPEEQYSNWGKQGIKPDFAVFKGDLSTLKRKYKSVIHVGDDVTDRQVARNSGFGYMTPEEFVAWIRKKMAKKYLKKKANGNF